MWELEIRNKFEFQNPKPDDQKFDCLIDLSFGHCFEFRHSLFGPHFVMAWRLHEHVLRGRIDNRARGRVIGEIWLAGIDQPLVLELKGDGAPDVAVAN
jgi:hypothetical protein